MNTSYKSSSYIATPYQLLALLLTLLSPTVFADTVLQDNAIVHYNRVSSDQLTLDIRSIESASVDQVNAQLNGIDLPVTRGADYPGSRQHTAILFLVDTSDPGRKQAVRNAVNDIEQLLQYEQPHYQYGLARFDTDLHFLTQIGVNPQTIRQQAQNLQAVGKTTELYRNTLGAIKQLSRYPADRKILFLLSDGRAEDQAYFHRDVVQSAIKNNVSIYTIGYADTVGLTVSLQTLRRLSEETGGQYLSTQPGTYQLDNNRLQQMFTSIDQGAQFDINLAAALQATAGGRQEITLSITSGASYTLVKLPVQLPATQAITTQQAVQAGSSAPQTIIVQTAPEPEIDIFNDSNWSLFITSMAFIALIIFLATRLRDKAAAKETAAEDTESTEDAYAWLEIADDKSSKPRRYPIRSAETKIGRYRGNDVALHDSAISRYHAEIHFTDDGRFVIADMGSKNGLIVNDRETLEHELHDNDIIEIGDVRLRFVMPEQLADDLQDTQIFKTQIPNIRSV